MAAGMKVALPPVQSSATEPSRHRHPVDPWEDKSQVALDFAVRLTVGERGIYAACSRPWNCSQDR